MRDAIAEAERGMDAGEVPVGCVFVADGRVVARGHNRTNVSLNACRHAELEAIDSLIDAHGREATLEMMRGVTVFVTIEPCIMCASALGLMHIAGVVFGAANDKFGGNGSVYSLHLAGNGSPDMHPYPVRGGLLPDEAIEMLRNLYNRANPRTRHLLKEDNGDVASPSGNSVSETTA